MSEFKAVMIKIIPVEKERSEELAWPKPLTHTDVHIQIYKKKKQRKAN